MNWTKYEVDFLEDYWGIKSIPAIAKELDKTINSIKCKAYKLGLGRHINQGEYITFNILINAIGYGGGYGYTVKRFERLGCPIKTKASIKKKYRIIYLEDFWKWAENHKADLNFANFEKGNLGAEPSWVDEKRKADFLNPTKKTHNRVWSKAHDNTLISMCKAQKYTYADIAKEINRTEAAIKRRLYDLKIPYRPLYRDNHIKWTPEENKRMLELHDKGYDSLAIAKTLNKTQLSISDRLKAKSL